MDNTQYAKQLCLERDYHKCRHCGSTNELDVRRLIERDGALGWHLSNLISLCNNCASESEEARLNYKHNRIGVILCGGRGTRLYPLTKYQNKHTLPIGLVPMIFYPLKTLRKFGIRRVLIVVDREGTNATMEMLGSGKEFGLDISYKVQEGAGGISEALYLAKDFAQPRDEIVCILGDNIFEDGDVDFNINLGDDKACIYVKEVSNPQDYGVATTLGGKVVRIIEKPKQPESNLAVVGLYLYTYDVFDIIETIRPSDRGELEISAVNDYYASQNKLQFKMVNGYWGDAGGSIRRYAECNMHGVKKANVSAKEIEEFKNIVFDEK